MTSTCPITSMRDTGVRCLLCLRGLLGCKCVSRPGVWSSPAGFAFHTRADITDRVGAKVMFFSAGSTSCACPCSTRGSGESLSWSPRNPDPVPRPGLTCCCVEEVGVFFYPLGVYRVRHKKLLTYLTLSINGASVPRCAAVGLPRPRGRMHELTVD